jgi:hypothetical protein
VSSDNILTLVLFLLTAKIDRIGGERYGKF